MNLRFRLHNNISALTMIHCSNMYLKEEQNCVQRYGKEDG